MTFTWLENGHVASPAGWRASTLACGIRYVGRDDLALVVSKRPCASAALFTTNLVKAAPVVYDQALIKRNPHGLQALVVSSGNANACTGADGDAAVVSMARATEQALDLPEDAAFVMSTGVIGMPMPVEKITRSIAEAARNLDAAYGPKAAQAIMTTDTRPKQCAVRIDLPSGAQVHIGGTAKGSGMIHPNMATMLGVITSDTVIMPAALDAALRYAVDRSFHCISVDGDTSTNDTLLAMANGVAETPVIDDITSPDGQAFLAGLTAVCQYLAKEVVRDGEGANRFVTIHVREAASDADAHRAAMAIARSPLVKTALFGADPNWGRILCATGYSEAQFDPHQVVLHLNGIKVIEGGLPIDFNEQIAHQAIDQPEVTIEAALGAGNGSATAWTCDFSYEYVRINAEYRT